MDDVDIKIFEKYLILKDEKTKLSALITSSDDSLKLEEISKELKVLESQITDVLVNSKLSTIGVGPKNFSFKTKVIAKIDDYDKFSNFVKTGDGIDLITMSLANDNVLQYIEQNSLTEEQLDSYGLKLINVKTLSVKKA